MFESERAEGCSGAALWSAPADDPTSPAAGCGSSLLEVAFAHLVTGLLDLTPPSDPAGDPADGRIDATDSEDADAVGDADSGKGGADLTADPDVVEALPGLDVLARAAALTRLDLSDTSDDALVDAVVAWQQVASWAAARQAAVIDELLARGGASSRAAEAVVHELTAALVVSRHAASSLVGRAVGLAASPQVADALADGRIDTARADVLTSYEVVPLEVRLRVAADLVGTAEHPGPATGLTPAQLRDRLRRAAIESDPDGATRRAEEAVARRHVWIDPAPDQMAWLTALLPAADAARIWAAVDGVSRVTVRAPGEHRTLAQVRADTLTDLVTQGHDGAGSGGGAGSDGTSSDDVASDSAASRRTGSHGTGSGCSPSVRTVINVTVAATTLLGADEAPGHLAGYGPIPAPFARALAGEGDATWRRILTDPVTGAATDVSRTTYRPGVVLGDLVRTRDATCTFPGCTVPAARCDLDHVEPFDPGGMIAGQTRAANLHPVCRAHHNAKTHGGWRTSRGDDGTITWSAPSGRAYTVPPRPADPSLERGPTIPAPSRRSGRREPRSGPAVGDSGGDPPF